MNSIAHAPRLACIVFARIQDYASKPVREQAQLGNDLHALIEAVLADLPSDERLVLDVPGGAAIVVPDDPPAALRQLMAESEADEQLIHRQIVHEFAERFHREHGLRLRFTEPAADRLVAIAQAAGRPVRDVCAERFNVFQFGLKLVAAYTGQLEFVIEPGAVDAPEKTLSDWVVASYRPATPSLP